jgi:riboflavin synthase
MFTGIVEECGELVGLSPFDGGVRYLVNTAFPSGSVAIGDSVAVNGCCLTAVDFADNRLGFDLLAETMRVTNLGSVKPGDRVNLERSLRFDGRVGGHFVTGHIDTTAPIDILERRGSDYYLRVQVPAQFLHYLVTRGCIAVDGISLTVAEVTDDGFAVWLIPHTMEITTLGLRKEGDLVNLEFDMLAKYVERITASQTAK